MYQNLFPEHSDKFKIIVAEINGKIEASCSIYIEQVDMHIRNAHISIILINPKQKKYREEIQVRLMCALECIANVCECDELKIAEKACD